MNGVFSMGTSRPRFSATWNLASWSPEETMTCLCFHSQARLIGFRASAAAFANTANLFIRRLAKSEDGFFKVDAFVLWWQPCRLRGRRHADSDRRRAAPRFSSMFARPIEKFPCCGSSASSKPSRRWFIIAVAIVKCSARCTPLFTGFGFSFPSIAAA